MTLLRHALLGFLALVALAGPAAAGGACSQAEIDRASDRLAAARGALLALPAGNDDETDVSPETRRGLAAMKARLGEFVAAHMRCVSGDVLPAAVASALSDQMPASDPPAGTDKAKERYHLSFAVRVGTDPRVVAVTAKIQMACGSDAMLLLFTQDADGTWKEVLRWQSAAYATIAGAFEAFDYRLSPTDGQGRWFVVAKSIAPWCSSTWSTIRYAVLRPVPGTTRPKVLLNAEDPIWWGNEDLGTLTVGREEFDLRFHAGSIDLGIHNRVWVRRFSVIGNAVQRIPPVAVNPRDFVDEWIVSPWRLAAQWSSLKTEALRELHERLRKIRYFEFESVRRCWDAPDHYQVGLRQDDGEPVYFFQVRGADSYTMAGAATKPAKACDGDNILETIDLGR